MTLTKADIVKDLDRYRKLYEGKKTYDLVEGVIKLMKETLENGEDILISGFGKFCVREKKRRKGRNPHTGEDLPIDARRVVVFQCSGVLRDKINGTGKKPWYMDH